MDYIKKRAE